MRERRIVQVVGVVVAGLAVLVGAAWVFQRSLIYLPSQAVPDPESMPAVEPVTFPTTDGLDLAAWFVPADVGEPLATVVVFNGNAGNRAGRVPLARALSAEGMNVLLVDYRGYGGNPGSPTETGLLADGRGAVSYLESRPDVDPDRIAYFGESLGAGVAIGVAGERPPAGMVLRSPFVSLPEVASVHYPILPTSWLLWDRFPNLERIGDLQVPVLVIAGSEDSIVPEEQSRRVFEAALEPKRHVVIEGANHNDVELVWGDEVIEETVRFIREHVVRKGAP